LTLTGCLESHQTLLFLEQFSSNGRRFNQRHDSVSNSWHMLAYFFVAFHRCEFSVLPMSVYSDVTDTVDGKDQAKTSKTRKSFVRPDFISDVQTFPYSSGLSFNRDTLDFVLLTIHGRMSIC
jgi:hypothetical protein